jgi:hygromycin-B 4-O-kinase
MSTLVPALSDGELHALLARALPGWDGALTPLNGGGTTKVYALEHVGSSLILRLSGLSESFAKDAYAAENFAAPGLPIPAMVARGEAADGIYFAITRRAPGEQVHSLSPERQRELAPAVLAALDQIHAIDVAAASGYGFWGELGQGRWPSWAAFLRSVAEEEQEGPFKGWTAMLADGRIDRAGFTTIYEAMLGLCTEGAAERVLLHGDLGFTNLLADERGITAVLDWANSMYGDPLYDLAWLSYWPSPVDWLGLWRARPGVAWDAAVERRVLCAWCYITLIAMRFFALAGQPHGPWSRDHMLGRLADARARGVL